MKEITLDGSRTVQAEQTASANSWPGCNEFRAKSDRELSDDDLRDIQGELGYSHYGYGFCRSYETVTSEGYVYTWSCWASCD